MQAKTLVVTPTDDVRGSIARGGSVFRAGVKTTVHVFSAPDYLQIKSCRFLRILKEAPIAAVAVGDEERAALESQDGDDEKGSPDIDLGKLSVAELRGIAVAANVDLPKRATKKQIIAALEATDEPAGEDDEDPEDDDGLTDEERAALESQDGDDGDD